MFPVVREVLAKCMDDFDIRETRIPYELSVNTKEWIKEPQVSFFKSVLENSLQAKEIYLKWNVRASFRAFWFSAAVLFKLLCF